MSDENEERQSEIWQRKYFSELDKNESFWRGFAFGVFFGFVNFLFFLIGWSW